MKLSDAIRLGAMLRPQTFGRAFRRGGSCALGAALEASGMDYNARRQRVDLFVAERWPWADIEADVSCPSCHARFMCAGQLVVHLNDAHSWKRERIADWVASVEPISQPLATGRGGLEDVDRPVPAPRV